MDKLMLRDNMIKFAIAVIVSQLVGVIGSLFTMPAISGWYANIVKPIFTPPGWVFGPVWTVLFLLMGISVFLIWKKGMETKGVKIALSLFVVQLVFNLLWSVIFFGFQNPGLAFIEIIFLWGTIIATMVSFSKLSKVAVLLLAPYLLWVSFAGYINFSIWQLNGPSQIACTLEAKICPDGSSVGRTGLKCEFSKCPDEVFKTLYDDVSGLVFEYSADLKTSYVSPVIWPPEIFVKEGRLTCFEDSSGKSPMEGSGVKDIRGREYCVKISGEGAAGSTYIDYYYSAIKEGKVIGIHFAFRYPQCVNYDDPEKSACELERKGLDIDDLADGVFSTIRYK